MSESRLARATAVEEADGVLKDFLVVSTAETSVSILA